MERTFENHFSVLISVSSYQIHRYITWVGLQFHTVRT